MGKILFSNKHSEYFAKSRLCHQVKQIRALDKIKAFLLAQNVFS